MSLLKIDDREKDYDLVESVMAAVEAAGHTYEVCRLEVGDYVWDDQICVEHKTVQDFVASVKSGLIDDQLLAIKQYPHHYLFIDGNWSRACSVTSSRRFTVRQKNAKILSILAQTRVPVYHVTDQNRLVDALMDVRRYVQDDGERLEFVQRYKMRCKIDASTDAYLKLPYCGPKRVERLVEEYPSYIEFLKAYRSTEQANRKKAFHWIDKRTRKYLDEL